MSPRSTVPRQPDLTGIPVPPAPAEVLRDLLIRAGLESAAVSSYERTTRRQAELMYEILRSPSGVRKAKALYSKAAGVIIDAFLAHREEPSEQVIERMTLVIEQLLSQLGDQRQTLMHVASSRHAIDVKPSSLADRTRFEAALRSHPDIVRYFVPGQGSERAYHLEIAREQAAVGGVWRGACAGQAVELRLQGAGSHFEGRWSIDGSTEWAPVTLELDRTKKRVVLHQPPGKPPGTRPGTLDANYAVMRLAATSGECTLHKHAAADETPVSAATKP